MKKEVLIIGGGIAGLSAGVELSLKGHQVTLIEAKGHLGGRAYSYKDPVTGSILENGPGFLMGWHRETLAFLDAIGTSGRLTISRPLAMDFAGPGLERSRFRPWILPSPLDLLGGWLFFRGLSLREKWAAWKFKAQAFTPDVSGFRDRNSTADWLEKSNQSGRLGERFWEPLSVLLLNDRPEISSAESFSAVLKEAFFSGRGHLRIFRPRAGFSDLYTEAARDFIEKRGGRFLLKSPVVKLHFQGGEFREAELEGGRRISAEVVLAAMPFSSLRKILPEALFYQDPFFSPIFRLTSSPIVTLRFWFDRDPIQTPLVGFWGTRFDWALRHAGNAEEAPYLSLSIAGARKELQTPAPHLIETGKSEILSLFPALSGAKLLRATVTKEPEAVMAPAVGVSRLRPSQKTPYKNFFLAGDWTDTGLPAGVESAVRSAKKAVALIESEA